MTGVQTCALPIFDDDGDVGHERAEIGGQRLDRLFDVAFEVVLHERSLATAQIDSADDGTRLESGHALEERPPAQEEGAGEERQRAGAQAETLLTVATPLRSQVGRGTCR